MQPVAISLKDKFLTLNSFFYSSSYFTFIIIFFPFRWKLYILFLLLIIFENNDYFSAEHQWCKQTFNSIWKYCKPRSNRCPVFAPVMTYFMRGSLNVFKRLVFTVRSQIVPLKPRCISLWASFSFLKKEPDWFRVALLYDGQFFLKRIKIDAVESEISSF